MAAILSTGWWVNTCRRATTSPKATGVNEIVHNHICVRNDRLSHKTLSVTCAFNHLSHWEHVQRLTSTRLTPVQHMSLSVLICRQYYISPLSLFTSILHIFWWCLYCYHLHVRCILHVCTLSKMTKIKMFNLFLSLCQSGLYRSISTYTPTPTHHSMCPPTWPSIHPSITLRPWQNVCHFADDNLKFIFAYKDYCNLIQISLKLVRNAPVNKMSAYSGLAPMIKYEPPEQSCNLRYAIPCGKPR